MEIIDSNVCFQPMKCHEQNNGILACSLAVIQNRSIQVLDDVVTFAWVTPVTVGAL